MSYLPDESSTAGRLTDPEAGVLGTTSAGRNGPDAAGLPAAILPTTVVYGAAERDAAFALASAAGVAYLTEEAPIKYADELYERPDISRAPIGTAAGVASTVKQMNPGYDPYLTKSPKAAASDHPPLSRVIDNVATSPGVMPPSSDGYLLSLLGAQ